jgi:hypothetical protein
MVWIYWPDLRCWFTNRRWCQLRSQHSAGTLAGNQLLPNATLKRDEKALIDLVDGLSSGSVVLVGVVDGDLAKFSGIGLIKLGFWIPNLRSGFLEQVNVPFVFVSSP